MLLHVVRTPPPPLPCPALPDGCNKDHRMEEVLDTKYEVKCMSTQRGMKGEAGCLDQSRLPKITTLSSEISPMRNEGSKGP
jgi:hypothetical protein